MLRATGPTSGSKIKVKMGATKDGKLVAAEVWMAYEAGAFPGSPVGAGAMSIIAPYNIPNLQIDAYDVVRQSAQDRGLSRARRDQRRLRRPKPSSTSWRRSAESIRSIFASRTRVKEGDAQVGRTSLQAHRLDRDLEGDQEQRALHSPS